jgi:Asp-tRNA(Asn)/Glu-tRNA(Gln) amidotransferase A subunit family amidase
VGYKPTFGWLPTSGLKCFSWSLDTVGLLTQNVADMARFAQAITGRALDPATSSAPGPKRQRQGGAWVVGVPTHYPWGPISASARQAIDAASRALQAQGVEVRPCELPAWAASAFDVHTVIQGFEVARTLGWEFDVHGARLSPVLRDCLIEARTFTPAAYEAAQHVAAQARVAAAAWMEPFDALLTPSAPDEAPLLTENSTGASTFNRLWSLLGTPCINVPGFVGVNGCPMGVQLIAPVEEDARLMQLAGVLEGCAPDGSAT